MNELFERYVLNVTKVQALAKPAITAGMSEAEMFTCIRDAAQQTHALRVENDELLKQLVFSRRPEDLSEEDVRDLIAFADRLFNYTRSLDVGIAYRVHQLLYAYALLHDDRKLIIRELYYQGLTLHYLNLKIEYPLLVNLYCAQIGEYFSKGASYAAQYEEIDDAETRGYIIRCMGNRKLGMAEIKGNSEQGIAFDMSSSFDLYEKLFEETMAFIMNPKYRAMNPDLPWEQYEYTMHLDRTTFLASLRSHYDERIARAVYESADIVYKHQQRLAQEKDKIVSDRIIYIYNAARYHAGVITIEELVDSLYSLCLSAQADDYSSRGIMLNLNMPLYLQNYAKLLPPGEQARYMPRVQALLDKNLDYLVSLPQNEYASTASQAVGQLMRIRSVEDRSFKTHMLTYVLACHAPTYIHSMMVAELTRLLSDRLLTLTPEKLVGLLGTQNVEEVASRRAEILDHVYQCGLYHDLGKCQMMHPISIYSRHLLDEEFNYIKYHPLLGSILLKNFDDMEDASLIALYHHHFYDDHGGYLTFSPPCPPSVKQLVNIVSICDAIDAATDNVGRSYANAKTLSQLLNELRADSNTRYARDVVRLFDDPDFCRAVDDALQSRRRAIYCQIYSDRIVPGEQK